MYSNKTLVGIGCSHVYGSLLDDENPVTCHERSWVKKLERLGNFKDSVNLGAPGGANNRSERVLFEYLQNNNTDNLVVIISLSEISRKEFFRYMNDKGEMSYIALGSWMLNMGKSNLQHAPDEFTAEKRKKDAETFPNNMKTFAELYYTYFHNSANDVKEVNRSVVLMHSLLKSLNIEHYFFEMLTVPNTIQQEQLGFTIPMIKFKDALNYDINANNFLNYNKIIPGKCLHWDHDGNEFLAEHLLKYIKENYYG